MAYINAKKRPVQQAEAAATPAKAARGPGEDEDSWVCTKCENLNFGVRLFCNMRNCQAPRSTDSWICPGCSNENYATRIFCNRRRCQMARPGITAIELSMQNARRGTKLGVGMAPALQPRMGAMAGTTNGAVGPLPAGSWQCRSCGNVNYPTRAYCNTGRCGKPREEVDGGPPLVAQGVRAMPRPVTVMPQAGTPVGAWVCLACRNLNYPTRTHCNSSSCGRPREEVDAGMPQSNGCGMAMQGRVRPQQQPQQQQLHQQQLQQSAPPGSWVCPACSNLNYPTRMHCNRSDCGQPRPAGI
eukprot:NODE_14548_length_1102_cov_4.343590.p1 GENE.NODE_14548_length_1102_cov_4.343590~~NODE_14548_length_1102_cov_4.343590.p1  ORF type:complete len:299 (-),score=76.42 NODE_14548_length_1102_cov_4.343590:114-1010(-)